MEQTSEVLILLGSASDKEYLESCVGFLKEMEIPYVVKVASAHRSPERVIATLNQYDSQAKVVLCFAGHAAHLAGVVAAHTTLPVIAVPLPSSDLKGMDALLASVQMPGGIPVATMAIGHSGAKNAACFAAQMLANQNGQLKEKLKKYRASLAAKVEQSSEKVEAEWGY